MQKTIKSSALIAAMFFATHGAAHAQSVSTQDSIVTVDQLLKIDNAIARDKAKKDALVAGVGQSQEAPKGARGGPMIPPSMSWSVESITGIADKYKINLSYNGIRADGVGIGQTVAGCVVKAVAGRCVVLEPVQVAIAKKKGKGTAAPGRNMCPTTCWTGVTSTMPTYQGMGGGPLPAGTPTSMRIPQLNPYPQSAAGTPPGFSGAGAAPTPPAVPTPVVGQQ